MKIESLGRQIRLRRRKLRLRQAELAALAGVGNRFLSELENGKASLELGKTMRVLETLGLDLVLYDRDLDSFAVPREF